MSGMFSQSSFNQDISNWDVSSVTDMGSMFYRCSFNQDISNWNVSSVTDMSLMFTLSAFNGDISQWDISSVTNMRLMFVDNLFMSAENYDKLLIGWSTLADSETRIPKDIHFGAPKNYTCAGAPGRKRLINDFGWTITRDSNLEEDTLSPAPAVAVLNAITEECKVEEADLTIPTAADACDRDINGVPSVAGDFPITSNATITWTYTDNADNTATQTQQVTITADVTNPVPAVLDAITRECKLERADLTIPTASDACDGDIDGVPSITGDFPIMSNTMITWTYTDNADNTVTQTQQVTITADMTNPVPSSALGDMTAECKLERADLPVPTAVDACDGDIDGVPSITGDFPITSTTMITWTYTDDAGNDTTQMQQVTITADMTNPVPSTLDAITEECKLERADLTIPTAVDICNGVIDGVPSVNGDFPIMSNTMITWTYTDDAGNDTTQMQQVTITADVTSPVPGAVLTAFNSPNCKIEEADLTVPTAMDACDGNINGVPSVSGDFPITSNGTVTWTYTDKADNTTTQMQQVTITADVTSPVLGAVLTAFNSPNCKIEEADLTVPTAMDACDGNINGVPSVSGDFPITSNAMVTWTYTDKAGNTATQMQQVTVTPDASAPNPIVSTLPAVPRECKVTTKSDLTAPKAMDTCDGEITADTDADFPITSTTMITWTYTDKAGNTTTQMQQVTITADGTSPVPGAALIAFDSPNCKIEEADLTVPTAMDACDGNINGVPSVAGNFPITSNAMVTWTYTDKAGNTATQTQQVTVIPDAISPVPGAALTAFNSPNCKIEEADLTVPMARDACDGNINGMPSVSGDFPIASNAMVTWTYTDKAGNTATQTQQVTVTPDAISPVPDAALTAFNSPNCKIEEAELTVPMARDACDGNINGVPSVSGDFPIASNAMVTWTYTDKAGNTATQMQQVTITPDAISPVPGAALTAFNSPNCKIEEADLTVPTAMDACDGNINGMPSVSGDFPIASNAMVTWTYTDKAGNTATQMQQVTITPDATMPSPIVSTLPAVPRECKVTAKGDLTAPKAMDACDGEITADTDAAFPITSTTMITWTYTDNAGNTATQTQQVTITADVTSPVPGAVLTAFNSPNCKIEEADLTVPTARDACDGNINGVPSVSGDFPITSNGTVTWTYADKEGNTATQTQQVTVTPDATSPVPGAALTAFNSPNCKIEEADLTVPIARDACDGDINGVPSVSGDFPITSNGTVTWTYTDKAGNTATQMQQVTITPDATAPNPIVSTLPAVPRECEVTAKGDLTAPKAMDACDGEITADTDAAFPITSTTRITWTYTDNAGNTATQTQQVMIIADATAPTPIVFALPAVSEECEVTAKSDLTAPKAMDACDGEITADTDDAAFPITSTTIITWIYTDNAGNTSTQTQQVIIVNTTNPVPNSGNNLPEIIGQCFLMEADLRVPTAMDNCMGSVTVTNSITSFPITSSTVITWTYTDAVGNKSTQTQQVTIEDTVAPVPDNNLSTINSTSPLAEGDVAVPTATDNCDGPITATTDADFPITFITTITWTYEDNAGNTSTQTQRAILPPLNTADNAAEVIIFPNPSGGYLEVQSAGTPAAADAFRILSLDGKPLLKGTTDTKVDITSLQSGLYLVQLPDGRLLKFIRE